MNVAVSQDAKKYEKEARAKLHVKLLKPTLKETNYYFYLFLLIASTVYCRTCVVTLPFIQSHFTQALVICKACIKPHHFLKVKIQNWA